MKSLLTIALELGLENNDNVRELKFMIENDVRSCSWKDDEIVHGNDCSIEVTIMYVRDLVRLSMEMKSFFR